MLEFGGSDTDGDSTSSENVEDMRDNDERRDRFINSLEGWTAKTNFEKKLILGILHRQGHKNFEHQVDEISPRIGVSGCRYDDSGSFSSQALSVYSKQSRRMNESKNENKNVANVSVERTDPAKNTARVYEENKELTLKSDLLQHNNQNKV